MPIETAPTKFDRMRPRLVKQAGLTPLGPSIR